MGELGEGIETNTTSGVITTEAISVEPVKKIVLPPAGPEEMAKSANTTVEGLNMSWTKGRNPIRYVGIGRDSQTPRKFNKGPRK